MIRKCVFSYLICEEKRIVPELPVEKKFGRYTILVDGNTPFSYACSGAIACAIYGLAVSVVSGESYNIAAQIAENCRSIEDVVAFEKDLGGKYIILFKCDEQYYIQGDATCSIPVYYSMDGSFICSSNFQYIVDAKKYHTDSEYSLIRNSSDIFQAMPYDITPYRQIKQLIPNHYLNINKQVAIRFINAKCKQKTIAIKEATEIVSPMIENILALYLQNYQIYCPITAGRDSRVVLSFLIKSKAEISCYTIKLPEHNEKTQDIVIPIALCKKEGIEHNLVESIILTDALIKEADGILGQGNYSLRTLYIAQTIKAHFGNGAIINGDIIGQIGKCSLHRDIPAVFATPSYFRCKLHNYSKGAKLQLKKWLNEIKSSGEKVNAFDLFSVENRMGRWASQTGVVYDSIGQVNLNVFNSRRIIYTWTAVERKKRMKSLVHLDLIKDTAPSLLDTPFEEEEGVVVKLAKSSGMLYLLASYGKYYVEKMKFMRKNKVK